MTLCPEGLVPKTNQCFQTGRLYIRKIFHPDAPFIYQLLNSPGWLQYVGDRGVDSVERRKPISWNTAGLPKRKRNFGHIKRQVEFPINTCGLYQRDNLEHPDIGFAFLPEYIGKVMGTKAARCLLDLKPVATELFGLYS